MPRKNLDVDGGIGGQCKIRKRRSSSSSSSSLVRSYRLKRAILVGKRGGPSTPVPMWKMTSKSASLQNEKHQATKGGDRGKELSVSARKLAATLWEINGVPKPKTKENLEDRKSEMEGIKKDRSLKLSHLDSMALCWLDSSYNPVSEGMDRPDAGTHCRRASNGSQKILPSDFNVGDFNSINNARLMEVDPKQIRTHGRTPRGSRVKHRLKDLLCAITTSKELLKVLNHLWRLEGQQSTSLSLLSTLKAELDRACIQVNKMIHEQKLNQREIDLLMHQFAEEKANWKIKERERIRSAITSIAVDLEMEKNLKLQSKRLNKKLDKELADTKATLSRAVKELESEKRAREILEQVCDELASGMGEDGAKVEELVRESAKVREEVEKEREMLQLADLLREERVQMKLSEAKYQFEEKNAVVEKLRGELEAYLKTKIGEEQAVGSPNYERIKELEDYLRETLPIPSHYQVEEKDSEVAVYKEEKEEAEDSAGSDLQLIELNMDNNSKSYKWWNVVRDDSKRMATNSKSKGRKSTSEKRQRQIISTERQISDGIEWEFSPRRPGNSDLLDGRRLFEFSSQAWKRESEDEIQRYNMIKDLRDHIVSSSRMASSLDIANPNQNWSQHNLPSQQSGM